MKQLCKIAVLFLSYWKACNPSELGELRQWASDSRLCGVDEEGSSIGNRINEWGEWSK
jgi:hypothetical protein